MHIVTEAGLRAATPPSDELRVRAERRSRIMSARAGHSRVSALALASPAATHGLWLYMRWSELALLTYISSSSSSEPQQIAASLNGVTSAMPTTPTLIALRRRAIVSIRIA